MIKPPSTWWSGLAFFFSLQVGYGLGFRVTPEFELCMLALLEEKVVVTRRAQDVEAGEAWKRY